MPQPKPQKKPVKRVVIKPLPKKPKTKGFFEEHYYPSLAAIFLASAFLCKGFSASLGHSVLYALWVTVFVAFLTSLARYLRRRSEPARAKPAARPAETRLAPARAAEPKKPMFKPLSPPPGKYPYYGPKKPQP